MLPNILAKINRVVIPNWITGPILSKELRVSSRRRRNYLLRFVYLALLSLFVCVTWTAVVNQPNYTYNPGYIISRMAEAGKAVVATVIWFQFIVIQLVAIIMLSTSIRDELEHQTLGTLMTTPITSLQIVMGKLLSKLLQLFLLLAISLPILAIVRVFGGVPWQFLIDGLAVTCCAMLLAGILSLYFSIGPSKAHIVIIKTLFTLAVLYAVIPTIVTILLFWNSSRGPSNAYMDFLCHFNPILTLSRSSAVLFAPSIVGIGAISPIPHCLIMLSLCVLLLIRCVWIVRRAALANAMGVTKFSRRKSKRQKPPSETAAANSPPTPAPVVSDTTIRRIADHPILWRELRSPFIKGSRTINIIGFLIMLAALAITYLFLIANDALRQDDPHTFYCVLFTILALLHNVLVTGTTITSEKESRTWPLILMTPLHDHQILLAKFLGLVRRCLPVWALLFLHVIIFTLVGYIHPVLILQLAIIVFPLIVFTSSVGLYFSARLKRTVAAVLATLAFAVTIWVVLPVFNVILFDEVLHNRDIASISVRSNPIVQVIVASIATAGERAADRSIANLSYEWPDNPDSNFHQANTAFILLAAVHLALALFFAWRARANFRKRIF